MKSCETYLEKLMDKSTGADTASAEDYIKDGLLYCGQCHTPKQVRVEWMGRERVLSCLCECIAKQRDQEEAERAEREKMYEIQKLRRLGFPDKEMQSWTFANDDKTNPHITDICRRYVDHFPDMLKKGKGLLLFGGVGTGKTFMSACIANALVDQGHPCMVTNFARLTNTLQGMFEGRQEYLDGLNRFSLLIIDDLGAERDTEYMSEMVMTIIDARYRSGLPMIITTNLTADELKHPVKMQNQRIYSRVFEMCIPVEVTGRDRRKEKLIKDYSEFNEVLGLKGDKNGVG